MDGVHFLMTGGTIDSHYDGSKDMVVPNEEPFIKEFLEGLKLYTKTKFTVICKKDSRDLTPKDMKRIKNAVEESPYKRIIITHGTYTMHDTARYLKANLNRDDQVIILTGSLIPIKGFAPSDAPFNLGYSLAKSESLDPGIYVCMNGRVFTAEEVMKIAREGRFVSIFGDSYLRNS